MIFARHLSQPCLPGSPCGTEDNPIVIRPGGVLPPDTLPPDLVTSDQVTDLAPTQAQEPETAPPPPAPGPGLAPPAPQSRSRLAVVAGIIALPVALTLVTIFAVDMAQKSYRPRRLASRARR